MTDRHDEQRHQSTDAPDTGGRREFLRSLGKWSQAVIGGVLLGGALVESDSANAWAAARGYGGSAAVGARGGWVNRYGGGGGAGWVNRSGGGGGWINGGGGSTGWVNRYGGGGGGSWVNRR
ncbi:MAG TPA: hypothetical protein PL166_14705 [Candidatus Contendobacter sp.]|nr:hypothetical protein [Candidatus Contendobacter sp.]